VTAALGFSLELPDVGATAALAAKIAGAARKGDVIALEGPLGSGKTTFARAFIAAACGICEVPSPTFTLVEVYPGHPPVWHFDLFRLATPEDAWELGLEEALADAISLIEWPERLGPLLPRERLTVALAFGTSPESRRAAITPSPAWRTRIEGLDLG
jgi:tRNA threonylcarbamoyl adenosine modification protein YjeE